MCNIEFPNTIVKQRVLHLTLQSHWYKMIAAGKKLEEYREIKDHWINRLALCGGKTPVPYGYYCQKALCISCVKRGNGFRPKTFDLVIAKNGYGKNAPTIKFIPGEIRIGKPALESWIIDYDWDEQPDLFIIPVKEIIYADRL